MIQQQIEDYCRLKSFHPQTQSRWLVFSAEDREALLRLAQDLKPGENHFKDLLDWLEEVALRDGTAIAHILSREEFSRIATDPRLGRNDKLRRIKDELRRLRFPRLSRIEEEIQRRVRGMKLDPRARLIIPAGLEGGAVTIEMKAASHDELKRLSAELARAVDGEEMKAIFALMRGEIAA
jgi:hypothetical protein